jgi:A/G-specific adenine glycosylase
MEFIDPLLNWYDEHGRDLPWRNTGDPYHITVSEIMLHQTQVSRVKTFYRDWLEQFPDWKTLAEATNADVIQAWAGLGYNRRALMLRDMAREIVEHGEPTTREEWQKLKGIGPYTSAAVALFANRQRTLPVDTNVRRVLGRVLEGELFPTPDIDDTLRERQDDILPERKRFQDIPQAIFDLANTHCAKTPDCAKCPLKDVCAAADAFLSGDVDTPQRTTPKANETIHRNKKYPDRIYRGRILKIVRESDHPVPVKLLGQQIDERFNEEKDAKWLNDMIQRLKNDKLLTESGAGLELPK